MMRLVCRDVDRIMKRVPDDEPTPKDPAQENIDVMDMVPLQAFEGQEHEAHIWRTWFLVRLPMVGRYACYCYGFTEAYNGAC